MDRKSLVTVAFFCMLFLTSLHLANAASKTVNDLNAAYLGETTAHAKYGVYAKVAEKEGYKDVAKLFRAVSMAESIHAHNHKRALEQLV